MPTPVRSHVCLASTEVLWKALISTGYSEDGNCNGALLLGAATTTPNADQEGYKWTANLIYSR